MSSSLHDRLLSLSERELELLLLQPTLSVWDLWNRNPVLRDPALNVLAQMVLDARPESPDTDRNRQPGPRDTLELLLLIRREGEACKRKTKSETDDACRRKAGPLLALLNTHAETLLPHRETDERYRLRMTYLP
nr:protein ORF59 [Pigeon adenovirus 1]